MRRIPSGGNASLAAQPSTASVALGRYETYSEGLACTSLLAVARELVSSTTRPQRSSKVPASSRLAPSLFADLRSPVPALQRSSCLAWVRS